MEARARTSAAFGAECVRLVRNVRERTRVVQRLVPVGLLFAFARAQSARASWRRQKVLTRRLVAAPYQDRALLCSFQHPSAISIRGLWIPSCAGPELIVSGCYGASG